ncbi:MAG: hypothetical protein U1E43_00085 [Rhodospirillales bacterium]
MVARNWNEAALAERADIAQLNLSLQQDLAARGAINRPDPEPFRATLRHAGFYSEWRHRRYGEEAWAMLEAAAGPLG